MFPLTDVLVVIECLLIVAVITTYLRQVSRGHSVPNPSMVVVRMIVMSLNAVTYFGTVRHDWPKAMITVVAPLGLLVLLVYASTHRKFGPLRRVDFYCLTLAVAIFVIWRISGSSVRANIMTQPVLLLAMYPTVLGVHQGVLKERPLPWLLGVAAYVLAVVVAALTFDIGGWGAFIHPLVSGIIGNGAVAYVAWKQTSSQGR